MAGLLSYLVGPGRSNEHTEPHLVAGDAALLAWFDDNELDSEAGRSIAQHLDRPAKAYGGEVNGGHVWHCSLALRAEEGRLTDQRWQEIASTFVDRMGFGDHEGTRAPTRWVAVHHGLSSNGNDHVHVVVNLVREDGTKASIHNDRIRARDLCRELEKEFGLQQLESAERGRATVGYQYGEREAQARRRARGVFEQSRRGGTEHRTWGGLSEGERQVLVEAQMRSDQPRWELARKVRACATASESEGEFVRRLRQHSVLVRPRFLEGRTDVVTGYSVAAKPVAGERPIWYGGGQLGKDLTLPRLRSEWPDTAHGAEAAVAEWAAARRGRRPVMPGRETRDPDPLLWAQVGADLERLREQMRAVPIEDRDAWAHVARQTAGAFAAWSVRVEPVPGPLAATADALSRTAQVRRRPLRAPETKAVGASGAALLLIAAVQGGEVAQAVMLRQLANLAKAIYDMHVADMDARRAAEIEQVIRGQLATVAARFPDPQPAAVPVVSDAVRTARQGQQELGSPIPNRLTPHEGRPPAHSRPGDLDNQHHIER